MIPTKWVLTASLALNVFLGTVLVVVYRPNHPPPPGITEIAERIAVTLPSADAAILREVVAVRAPEIESGHRTLRAFPDQVRAVLGMSDFEPGALRQLFTEFSAARQRMDDALAALVIEAATRMSHEGRAAISRWNPPPPPPPPFGHNGPSPFGGNGPPPPPPPER
ncbi:periplasmic heavy metal sensor [Magnetospirillum molischianum]|uniref:periplasmic heavy metal sensor n=1 Tax=Magnetospirillum molischianum TaxID=1083 RepID=UPI00138AF330|nr:periplasmic heavy metal sensor [Magnetospirillum molischianum]